MKKLTSLTDLQLIHIVGSHQNNESFKLMFDALAQLKHRGYNYIQVIQKYIDAF